MTRSDPEMMSFVGSRLEVAVESQSVVLGTFELIRGWNSQEEAVT